MLFFFVERLLDVDTTLDNCDLKRLMQELIGSYIMMEEYFMREMVLKVDFFLRYLDKNIYGG